MGNRAIEWEIRGLIMGMYTELVIGVSLKPDERAINILRYMLKEADKCPPLPSHALFSTERWEWMLRCDSYYFDGKTQHLLKYDDIGKAYHLNVRCNLKNYCCEIKEFLDWLCPYIKTEGFLGYTRYEKFENPTLIYKYDGKIEYV